MIPAQVYLGTSTKQGQIELAFLFVVLLSTPSPTSKNLHLALESIRNSCSLVFQAIKIALEAQEKVKVERGTPQRPDQLEGNVIEGFQRS